MKKYLLALTGAFVALTGFSQKCLTDQMLDERFRQHPELGEEAHRFMSNLTHSNDLNRSDSLVILPIVFHIIHDNGFGNISEEQIHDAIRVLNRDINRLNPDTTETRDMFKPHTASANVEFRIAKLDPDGFCTNGITRHNLGDVSYDARDNIKRSSSGGVDAWPTDRYFNVWVVNSIESSGGGEGITLGYAQFPFSFGGGINETYGIVARQDYLGTIGTSNDDGRMLTHEVGHCLGLFHTFQGGCSVNCDQGGDYICDTPPSSEATFGCDINQNTCPDPANDPYPGTSVVDQIENYMSYDNCTNMFSTQQVERMRGVVTNNLVFFGQQQNIPEMETLTSPENLEATGVFLPGEPCKVVFNANITETCVGETITFTDFSYHKISSWNWSFPGGTPATSELKNPTVTYDTPGTYDVLLTISDSNGTSVDSNYVGYITVTEGGVSQAPIMEGFESSTVLADLNFSSINRDNDGIFWRVNSSVGANSSQSLYLNNHQNNSNGKKDVLISESYDLSNLPDALIAFDQSFAVKDMNNTDNFTIEISPDCGLNWNTLSSKSGISIGISSITTSNYVPTNWRHRTIDIPDTFLTENIKFRFTFTSGGGNNFYLDNLHILSTVGVSNFNTASSLSIYPNPFTNNATLMYQSAENARANVTLYDMVGKSYSVVNDINITTGENKINLDGKGLSAGVYLLKLELDNGKSYNSRVIIK